jgi:phosphoadenosine phosphosulfate reductase
MDREDIDIDRLQTLEATDLLAWAFENFGDRAAIGTSLQKTGSVMIDLASRLGLGYRVFFIETLMDYPETYRLLERTQKHYGIEIERFAPHEEEIRQLRDRLGRWEHFMDRRACCFVRKSLPMQRAQHTLDVWISGLRADQSDHRAEKALKAAWVPAGEGRKILKLNPLLEWDEARIDDYIRDNDVPINELYAYESEYGEKFGVISCQRCHIPVKPSLLPRGGKWPWENEGIKECGLHIGGDGI